MNSYNDIAQEFYTYGKEAITDIEIGYKSVLRLIGDSNGQKVLDYGCGVGKFSRILKDLGVDVVGLDIAEAVLEIAKKNNQDISFLTVAEGKKMLGKEFDLAVLSFVTTAISSGEIVKQIFKDIGSFLKPGGRLIMLNSNYERSGNRTFLTFKVGAVVKEIGHPLSVFLGPKYDLQITDYYYPERFYIEAMTGGGLRHELTLEPLADNHERPWKDEFVSPPFMIMSATAV